MAQDENGIPIDENSKRHTADMLPRYFRTTANKKFLSSTLDQLMQPGVVQKTDGFIGRKNAKAYKAGDNYLAELAGDRRNYQLEPVALVEDAIGNTTFYRDYRDYVNASKIRNGEASNHSLLNSQEYYAWNPHIDWDKFVNFREYYWLPSGPDSIPVYGSSTDIVSTFSVGKQDNTDNFAYTFNPDVPTSNPTLTLYRGQTYTFDINTIDMPLSIRTSRSVKDNTNLYNVGVSQQSVEQGQFIFVVDLESPDYLYYTNDNDIEASGLIIIKDIIDATEINVGTEILGKKTYTMQNGYELSNGMRVNFYGKVTPEIYATGTWYVEGVGSSIKLISESDLVITADYLLDQGVEYDMQGFADLPFDEATSYATLKDYIVINRAAKDRNQWSRYNKWTHKSVIETTALINNVPVELDQNYRATRPIIEFEAGLKLFNYGTEAKGSVDLVDTVTKDVFSDIEGQVGYFVDGIELVNGMRVLFTADPDSLVNGKIYEVKFISHNGSRQITLVETTDTTPLENETVLVKAGVKFKGKVFYYTGLVWKQAQDKISVNQQPLFDLYNDQGIALSTLDGSSFVGNKIFSYKVGTGTADTELGFPLSYRTIENSGDIVFDFNLLSDTYQYDVLTNVLNVSTDTGLLRKYSNRTTYNSVSAWTKGATKSVQPVVQQPTVDTRTNNFIIDVYDNSATIPDLEIRVYVNNVRKKENTDYIVDRFNGYCYINFNTDLTVGDKLIIKTYTKTTKNSRGYYEFPTNFEKNPLNENVETFTLGEVLDHVGSIVDNAKDFNGIFPGTSNLKDLGDITPLGLKFVQHSGPINLALYNTTNKDFDAIRAIRYSGLEYIKFKREFLRVANELGFEGETKIHVDKILQSITEVKTNKDPFYFSDMVPFSSDTVTRHVIEDQSQTVFSLKRGIDFTKLNQYAVLPYFNGSLLVKDRDYTVTTSGFLTLNITVANNDILDVYEFESTDGCWVPPTPTKLGLYPKYTPEIFLDDTYINVVTEVTGPYKVYGRDETTTQNFKGKVGWFYPVFTSEADAIAYDTANGGAGVAHDHLFAGCNQLFFMPESSANHATNDVNTFEAWPGAQPMLQGHDGSLWKCFGDYRDRLLLDFERRIYANLKQQYNEDVFDIADFIETKSRKTGFTRYGTARTLISEFNRWLETIGTPDYSANTRFDRTNGFTFSYSKWADIDDQSLPGFWRAIYKDFYNTDRPHSHPWEILGLTEKPSWFDNEYGTAPYTRNNLLLWKDMANGVVRAPNTKIVYRNKFKNLEIANYIPTDDQGNLLPPNLSGIALSGLDSSYSDGYIFGDEGPVETAWRRSSHYPFALMASWAINNPAQFFGIAFDVSRIKRNAAGELVYTETSKRIKLDKLKFPNSASDNSRVFTAGIINYIQGYLAQNETLKFGVYQQELISLQNKLASKIGGFTQKSKFRLILDARTPTNEGNVFVPDENYKIQLTKSIPIDVYSYSGMIIEIVPQGFVIRGYDRDLPLFKTYAVTRKNNDRLVRVGGVSESFLTWDSGKFYEVGQIVENNNVYYRVKVGHTSGASFNLDNFQKLAELPQEGGAQAFFSKNFDTRTVVEVPYGTLVSDIQGVVDIILGYEKFLDSKGFKFELFNQNIEEIENWTLSAKEFMFWTTQNWDSGTVITLSPSARQVKFEEPYTVVDDIYNNFYDYSLLKADGKRLLADFASTERDNTNIFGIYVKNTEDGIFHLKVPVVQHEHAVIIDNKTVFNDVIYNRAQGYRQERIKVKGYRSDDWNGSYNIPGFIFDDAKIEDWTSWQDYSIGALVKHKQYYYVAKVNVVGTEIFNERSFVKLNEKPEQRLLPNWDYKAKQFTDFYDLDSDNFDTEQQRLAQHLIGYQKRRYLENIINDDVSQFKFFQGAIQDKGTKNVLTKLFDKLGSANKDSLEFFEEWAVRLGRYGATSGDDQFDIILDESKYRQEPQTVELVNEIDPQDTSLVYRLNRNNIYVKSKNYDHTPFPVKYFNDNNSYTKTAGYVNTNDVKLSLLNYDDLLTQPLSAIDTGKFVWTANDKSQQTWGVYKHDTTNFVIKSVTATSSGQFTITLDRKTKFAVGDIIGIVDTDATTDGFYKIAEINLNKIVLSTEGESTELDDIKGYVTFFKPVRLSRLSDANAIIDAPATFSLTGETSITDTIWVDDDDTGQWIVLKNKQVYELKPDIKNVTAGLLDSTDKDFGSDISVSTNNNTIAISAPKDLNGSVYVFARPSDNTDFGLRQQIDEFTGLFDSGGGFGASVSISPDGQYIAVGSPNASNVKSKFRSEYKNTVAYNINDIVLYRSQLWKSRKVQDADTIQQFLSHASNQQSKIDEYDSNDQSYPDVEYMVRGNYTIEDAPADHILIRAQTEQFEGTKPGDVLELTWNRYTTATAAGIAPFNGDAVLNEAFINGSHEIVHKVEAVVHIQSALSIPSAGSDITTDTAKATIVYRYVNDENQMTIYLNNLNGSFLDTGSIYQNGVLVGDYERQLKITDNYHSGWWHINVGSEFSTTELVETNANLVVTDIKLENELRANSIFTNILDVKQLANITTPTFPSEIGVLSHQQGQTGTNLIDSRWWFRTSASHYTNTSVNDEVRFWLNQIRVNGAVQDPEPVLGLSFNYLNNSTHTVVDKWNGWLEVRLTNFDLSGNPFIPVVGTELIDSATGETAEVAWIERAFGVAKIYLKNKSGQWAFGSDYEQNSTAQFIENDSTLRTIGPINACHLENSINGGLIVIDTGVNIPVPANQTYLRDLEYWQYSSNTIDGILETAEGPSSLNLDWTRVYNIPATTSGYSSGNDSEGTFAIYKKIGSIYELVSYYTVPNSDHFRRLGATCKIVQKSPTSYRLFVLAKGDNTETNQGRIYFFDKNDNEDWNLGIEPLYRGMHSVSATYFDGEYVRFGNSIYEAKTNITPGAFSLSQWTEINSGVDLLGYVPNDTNYSITESTLEQQFLEEIGEGFDTSSVGEVLALTARYTNPDDSSIPNRKVVVYKLVNDQYVYSQLLEPFNLTENFGNSIAVSNDGKKIAVGAPLNSDISLNGGAVYIYILKDGTYTFSQTLRPKDLTANTQFGFKLDFDGNTLAINSKGGDIVKYTTFDVQLTTFDGDATKFNTIDNDSGLVSIYETINDTLLYGQDFSYDRDTENFGNIIKVSNNHVYLGLPDQTVTTNNTVDKGVVAEFRKPANSTSWTIVSSPVLPADLSKFKGVYLYNKIDNSLVAYLDYIDPIQGKIAGVAEQEISFKTSYDPARYSVSTNADVTAQALDYTSTDWVGKLWWDIDSARFINHHQGDITEATANFNKLYPGTTVDVYEWVETTLKPSEWDRQAETEAGLAKGISGTSKYGDAVYSVRRKYNSSSQTFTTYYYYWVKDKATIPAIETRKLSARSVSRIIANPENSNIKFVAILGNNRFAIYNCESLIEDKDVAISFNWWTIDNQEQNTHIQYQLISDGLETSRPNRVIEQKWIDSLVGFDINDRPVPDINLPVKQKYGSLNEPRQSWFINKTEARKQFVERANKVLAENLIVDEFDLSKLTDSDPLPTIATGIYDTTSDSYAELRFVSIAKVRPASLQLEIENGTIINVLINDAGQGYINPPTYNITDTLGTEGELEFTLNANGGISNVRIINAGKNYTNNVKISVRNFAVLVKSDETINGKWSVYQYISSDWQRVLTQSYDVNLYWTYKDWYASGYNQFTLINYTLDGSYQIYGLEDNIGDVIKISNVGSGGWLLLEKVDNQDSVDYSVNYKTIGRERGTIELLDSLYDVTSDNVAYDGASFDKIFYDTEPVAEFRKIITILRDSIFIDQLQIHWNEMFFAGLRYVFSEQPNVDWAFKTSFVKAKHNVGELEQKVTFQNDNLSSYESYVEEMKPYKTKIREYISSYEKIDPANNVVTDFDLAPVYNEAEGRIIPQSVQVVNNEIIAGVSNTAVYPSKHWLDNVGFEVTQINIAESGRGYTGAPKLLITGGGGTGATAQAFIGDGKITSVLVTNPGSGYLSQPTIEVIGSLEDDGTAARLSPVLGNGKARSAHIRCKFDRVTKTYLFQTLNETETFATTLDQLTIDLKWPMELKTTQITVTIDGLESLRSEYSFSNVKDTTRGYTRYFGRITFTNALAANREVVVKYNKAPDLLQAQDRINLYYNPNTGMYGNDLGQLLQGVDYGGVEVTSFDFGGGSGWDSDGWFTSTYDTFDTTFEDEIFQFGDDSTRILTFASPLETGIVYNVYKNGVRIDDPNYPSNPTNPNALIASITGAGQTGIAITDDGDVVEDTIIVFDEDIIPLSSGDILVFRKTTSDGSFLPDPRSYDTILSGGDLQFNTARGFNPEDIIVDGDSFVTPTTSKGTEEQVPGQILDAVDIRVFHRPEAGGSVLSSNSYRADGINSVFDFGIQPQNSQGLIVKLDSVIQPSTNYTVNYKNKTVTFSSVPTIGTLVNIVSISGNGQDLLEEGQYVADGSTTAFTTKAKYTKDLDFYVTVDGKEVEAVLIDDNEKAQILFGSAPKDQSLVSYFVYSTTDSFSKIAVEEFTGDGSTKLFDLTKTPYSAIPNSHNVIVKQGNRLLNPGFNQQFDVTTAQREYFLEIWQTPVGSFDASDVLFVLNGRELTIAVEYNIRPSNSSVILEPGIGNDGDILEAYIVTDGDYAFGSIQQINNQNTWVDSGNTLQLKVAPEIGEKLTVYTFNKHDSMGFERINYDIVARETLVVGTEDYIQFNHIKNGLIKLRYPAVEVQYVWLTVNGVLQTPSVDYTLTTDKQYIRYKQSFVDNDVVEVIQFSATGQITPKFGFSQFKDILNRNIYKRLGDVQSYKLAEPLLTFDKQIVLDNADGLSAPDKNSKIPGIIFVNGERIEYLIKDGNTLKQIQRGTLGTGVPTEHLIGSDVYNASQMQTAPYADKTIVDEIVADGTTNTFELGFTPTSVNEFEVFVGGRRLRKNSIQSFDHTRDQDSPEADVTLTAEYSVDGTTPFVSMLNTPAEGIKIQIVRRQGTLWTETPGITLFDSETLVARFFKAEKVELPK